MAGWHLILDPASGPESNMARDKELADRVCSGESAPILRIYRWSRPAISLGRRQSPEELPSFLLEKGWPLVRRPTGGGAVVHRTDEMTYAMAIPIGCLPAAPLRRLPGFFHESLRQELIHRQLIPRGDLAVLSADSSSPAALCFSYPVCGDLLYQGKKAAGSALRVWREGALIQGSIQGFPVRYDQLAEAVIAAVRERFLEGEGRT